jgi:hypothetical protein
MTNQQEASIMTSSTPTYFRSVLIGAAAWLVATALLHSLPLPLLIDAEFTPKMAALALANSAIFAVLVYFLVRRKPGPQRFPASAAIVMPVAFGDAIAVAFARDFFPGLSPNASGMFAAFLLLTSAVILATGYCAGLHTVPDRRLDRPA